jgi:hypothetical protein
MAALFSWSTPSTGLYGTTVPVVSHIEVRMWRSYYCSGEMTGERVAWHSRTSGAQTLPSARCVRGKYNRWSSFSCRPKGIGREDGRDRRHLAFDGRRLLRQSAMDPFASGSQKAGAELRSRRACVPSPFEDDHRPYDTHSAANKCARCHAFEATMDRSSRVRDIHPPSPSSNLVKSRPPS